MNPIKTTIRAVVIAGAIMFGGVVGWQFVSPVLAPTNPARPAEIEPRDATIVRCAHCGVPIQQPLRCTGQLCLPIPAQPAQVSMKWDDWRVKFSANVDPSLSPGPAAFAPARHGWSFYFQLPETTYRSQSIYYEITTASPLLIQGWYVKMGGRVSPLPPRMDCRMYFQEVGDDLSGQGQYAYYRWRSTKPLIPSASWLDNFVVFVGLEPEFWSTVTGKPGNWSNFVTGERGDASAAATAGFQRALANPQSIGIICGAYVRGDPFAGDSIPDLDVGHRFPTEVQFSIFGFAVCDPFAGTSSAKQENEACAPPHQ
jgi:hypothetical protein